jgi:hypothetical protein
MNKRFKQEFEFAKVTIQVPGAGRITVDCTQADPNQWASIPEFAHLVEDDTTPEPIAQKIVKHVQAEVAQNDFSSLTLNELREMFPDIKATSKKDFIAQIV